MTAMTNRFDNVIVNYPVVNYVDGAGSGLVNIDVRQTIVPHNY